MSLQGSSMAANLFKQSTAKLAQTTRFFINLNKPRAFYLGWVGFGNLGDEALFQAIRHLLGDQVALFVPKYAGRRFKSLLPQFRLDLMMLGGGTLIGKEFELPRIAAALDLYPTAKFVTFGAGVIDRNLWESFGVETNIAAWDTLLARADMLTVRGPLSLQHLQEWEIQSEAQVIGDPALWWGRDKIRPKSLSKRIGINLGPSKGRIFGQDEQAVAAFGARLLRRLANAGWHITAFPMIREDVDYLQRVIKESGISGVQMHTDFHNLPHTMNRLEQQDIFLGEKLHSVVLANCVYTPAVMLAYRTKGLDYMCSMDQEWLAFRTDDLELDRVYESLMNMYDEIDANQARLHQRIHHWKTELNRTANRIVELVNA